MTIHTAGMRNVYLSVSTLALTAVVICNAYLQKKQFYPSVVYITKSNPSMAVIYLQGLIIIWLFGKMMQKIFFGELRAAEIEHLIERFWYAITETCLAFTVFKDDFSPKFIALFALLLFIKTFHWLAEDRVDYMERSPIISWLFHTRIVLLLTLLGAVDLFFISFAYYHTVTKGASVQLVFGFEYAILLTIVANTCIKYVLHIIDMNREVFWENKAVFLLHVEVFIGLIKVGLYMMFVVLMIKLYTLPLFAFRPMYQSMRNFKKALNDVIQSRRAILNMNTLYPHATAEELAAVDNVCIICREEMQVGAKKLPCNHIFHVSCLRSWFQRHQTCPTCRLNVLRPTPEPHTTNHGVPPPQPQPAAPRIPPMPPMFGWQAWQPLFMPPPMPPMNLGNAPNAGAGTTARPPTSQDQSQQPRPDSQPSTAADGGAAQFADGSAFPRQFPFPFMIPPMPSLIPGTLTPPMPPQYWTGLSVPELRQMEDAGREGVEARLQCLRNIHTLMDASVILMQQYVMSATIANASTAAATASGSTSPSSGAAASSTTAAAAATTATASAAPSESTPTPSASSSQITTPTQSTESQSTADSLSEKNANDVNNQNSTFDPSSSESSSRSSPTTGGRANALTDEQEDIRRRRVQKFTNVS